MAQKGILLFLILIIAQIILLLRFGLFDKYSKEKVNVKFNLIKNHSAISEYWKNIIEKSSNLEIHLEQWHLKREQLLNEGLNAVLSKSNSEFRLLIRKILLLSVREVNALIKYENCAKWWANPLSITMLEQKQIPKSQLVYYKLNFEIHPGGIPFQSEVLSLNQHSNQLPSSKLVLIGGRRLDGSYCTSVSENIRNICSCPEERESAEAITSKIRSKWNSTDIELNTWPPNFPMFVSEYINLGNKNHYLKTPINDFCNQKLQMVVLISSAPTHFVQRKVIRNTFGDSERLKSIKVKLVFLFGKVEDANLQKRIDEEFNLYNDIVQANFADSYHNLSLSHLSMYDWVLSQCRNQDMPPWILKADDDFFLNVNLALKIAEANPDAKLIGCLYCGTKAIRDPRYMSKYYVPRYMFIPDWYPGYLSGVAYMIRTDILESIIQASRDVPIIHMDDAYVTGLLAREVGIRPRTSLLFTYGRVEPDGCQTKLKVSSYVLDSNDMLRQWKSFLRILPNDTRCKLKTSQLMIESLTRSHIKDCMYK